MIAIAATLALCVLSILGDYFLKRASAEKNPLWTVAFAAGFAIYSSTVFGWMYLMRHLKLAVIGVVYCVGMSVLLALLGVVFFNESLSRSEIIGFVLALASLALLARFT